MTVSRIYMDSNCFIESVKSTVGTGQTGRDNDLWHIKHLLLAAKQGQFEIITSYLTLAESRSAGQSGGPTEEVKRLLRSILSSGKVVKLAQMTKSTAEFARDLHWVHGINLGGADSIHVATAINTECKEFLTFDSQKRNSPVKLASELQALKPRGILTIEPASTSLLPPEYYQNRLPHTA